MAFNILCDSLGPANYTGADAGAISNSVPRETHYPGPLGKTSTSLNDLDGILISTFYFFVRQYL